MLAKKRQCRTRERSRCGGYETAQGRKRVKKKGRVKGRRKPGGVKIMLTEIIKGKEGVQSQGGVCVGGGLEEGKRKEDGNHEGFRTGLEVVKKRPYSFPEKTSRNVRGREGTNEAKEQGDRRTGQEKRGSRGGGKMNERTKINNIKRQTNTLFQKPKGGIVSRVHGTNGVSREGKDSGGQRE